MILNIDKSSNFQKTYKETMGLVAPFAMGTEPPVTKPLIKDWERKRTAYASGHNEGNMEMAMDIRDMAQLTVWLLVSAPLKNMSQLGVLFPIFGKIKNVPNHQPAVINGMN